MSVLFAGGQEVARQAGAMMVDRIEAFVRQATPASSRA